MAKVAKDAGKRQYVGYGVKPPYLSLREAIETIKDMYEKSAAELSVESLADLLGNTVRSSSFKKKMMALKNYGLIDQASGNNAIRISNLGMKIVAPSTPNVRVRAKKESFLRINTFMVLHKLWEGKILPAEEFFRNTLREKCGIPPELLEGWRDIFIESAQEASLLQQRTDGKMQVRSEPIAEEAEEGAGGEGEENLPPEDPEAEKERLRKPPPPSPVDKSVKRFQIQLLGEKIGAVELPIGWDAEDVRKMIRVIRVMFLPEEEAQGEAN